jgi:hypothetical protein
VHPGQAGDSAADSGFGAIALTATPLTTMAELGYSLEAQDVLERMGIHNARELLAVDRIRFRYLRGVGDKIRKEIRLTAKDLARLRPDLTQGRAAAHDDEDADGAVSINELAAQLLPRRPAGDDRPEEAALAHYLGLDDAVKAGVWPSLGDSAQAGEVDRTTLTAALIKARERWLKNPAFTELRQQIDSLLRSQGQVMSAGRRHGLAGPARLCAQDDVERLRQATAVLRAAVEAEAHLDQPRFEAFDHQPSMLIASASAWADYARQLGAAADACALADPLLPPSRVLETLEGVPLPQSSAATQAAGALPIGPLTPTRLLRLAASASRKAAVSSRQEIYPRGMAPLQALKQSLGALVGAPELRRGRHSGRVQGRYPEAAGLPQRPELDRLLEESGAPLAWDPPRPMAVAPTAWPRWAGRKPPEPPRSSRATPRCSRPTHRATTMWSRPQRWKTAWCAVCSKAACWCSPSTRASPAMPRPSCCTASARRACCLLRFSGSTSTPCCWPPCATRPRRLASTGTSCCKPTPPTAAAATGSTCSAWFSAPCQHFGLRCSTALRPCCWSAPACWPGTT